MPPAPSSSLQATPTLRRNQKVKRKRGGTGVDAALFVPLAWPVLVIFLLTTIGFLYTLHQVMQAGGGDNDNIKNHNENTVVAQQQQQQQFAPPQAPILPIFSSLPHADYWIDQVLQGHPTVAGVTALLQRYVNALHDTNMQLSRNAYVPPPKSAAAKNGGAAKNGQPKPTDTQLVLHAMFDVTQQHLGKFDELYRDKLLFDIDSEEQGTIFLSLAAFREHLLAPTLYSAFDHAAQPDKLFIGAVVQNCFGQVDETTGRIDTTGLPCRTGLQVIGKNQMGKDMTQVSDAPPDKNGIEEFCTNPLYQKYCDNGQIRVLWVHETESLGPAMARYLASKLWGGETYYMQCDSHLKFAPHWDDKYRAEIQATRNYPKSVLSSYPPGFHEGDTVEVQESKGARLCTCATRLDDPNPIVRINTGNPYRGHEPRPTQIPFIAAGFFFAHATFLRDVPFDPYLFWLFMGEEIALSMRAWTHGWDIYAPRKNLIVHQYRPGRLGLPKFWETANRLFRHARGGVNLSKLQRPVLARIKHMVGYPDSTRAKILQAQGHDLVLTEIEHYGLGHVRSWQDYLEFAHMVIDPDKDIIVCSTNTWCNQGLKD